MSNLLSRSIVFRLSGLFSFSVIPCYAANPITSSEAHTLIAPIYDALNDPAHKDTDKLLRATTSSAWVDCSADSDCQTRDATIAFWKTFRTSIPDLRWQIKDVMVSGNEVVVRSEASGTPSGPFFGIPYSGKSFHNVMSIDIHTVLNGKIVKSYHVENWPAALQQLSAKN